MLKVLSHLERYDCFVISLLIFKCNAGFDGFSHKVVESPESKAMRRMSMENMQVTSPLPKEKSFFNVMT